MLQPKSAKSPSESFIKKKKKKGRGFETEMGDGTLAAGDVLDSCLVDYHNIALGRSQLLPFSVQGKMYGAS